MLSILRYIFILLLVSTNVFAVSYLAKNNSAQLLSVKTKTLTSTHATLQRFQRKTPKESWHKVGTSFPVVIGKNGSTATKKEGDLKTPLGTFHISAAFGIAKTGNTLTKMPYIKVIPTTFCVDDIHSAFYNTIINTSKITKPDWHSGEEMFKQKTAYNLGLVIDNNKNPIIAGNGSCVFIHIWKSLNHPTAGCVAMAKSNMKILFAWLDPQDHPTIRIWAPSPP